MMAASKPFTETARNLISICLTFFTLTPTAQAEELLDAQGQVLVPEEVRPFIESPSWTAIYVNRVDLNRDQRADYLVVRQQALLSNRNSDSGDSGETPRTLMILQREEDGHLVKIKENKKIIFCPECGGMRGDPFSGIDITHNGFNIPMYGGGGERWLERFDFGYSRRDKTWQLTRISYADDTPDEKANDPDNADLVEKAVFTPRDFGKIDLADFDPDLLESLISARRDTPQ